MIRGILFAVAACFIWGLIFVVPPYMEGFDAFEIALGRHSVFGAISLLFLFTLRKKIAQYSLKIWATAFFFALIANITYYSCVVIGVTYASPPLAALILGSSPIAISFYGNFVEKNGRFKELIVPALLILAGLCLVNFHNFMDDSTHEKPLYWMGALAACVALIAWSWFVVKNARFLKNNPTIAAEEWSTLLGTATFTWVIILGTLYESWQGAVSWHKFTTPSDSLQTFVIGCLILGILCSWLGSFLWNNACTRLPISFAGELTILETIFGLMFFYFLEQRLPPATEFAGAMLMFSAIFYSMRSVTATEPTENYI